MENKIVNTLNSEVKFLPTISTFGGMLAGGTAALVAGAFFGDDAVRYLSERNIEISKNSLVQYSTALSVYAGAARGFFGGKLAEGVLKNLKFKRKLGGLENEFA